MRPFLKWAGGKYSIIEEVKSSLQEFPNSRLIEPFVGSGAVFLNTDYNRYLLADFNSDLINLYRLLKKYELDFIDYAQSFFNVASNTAEVFYDNRDLFNTTEDSNLKSALFLYLNKHSFNGLTRYNSNGEYNAPFGSYVKPYFPKKEMLYFAKKIKRAVLKVASFEETMLCAKPGDVVYCDPPYVPISDTANFRGYTSKGFSMQDQVRLSELAKKLRNNNINVIISNHNTAFTRKIYSGSNIKKIKVQRNISCKANTRQKVEELIAVFS